MLTCVRHSDGSYYRQASEANEQLLLHGTPPQHLFSLLSTGLNERFSGSNAGTIFGDGIYLAEEVTKSDQYVEVDAVYDKKSDLHKRLYPETDEGATHPGDVYYVLASIKPLSNRKLNKRTSMKVAPAPPP